MNEAMQRLIDAVERASPTIWKAAYRQVYVDGIENLLLLILFAWLGRFLWNWSERKVATMDANHWDDDDKKVAVILLRIGVAVCVVLVAVAATFAIDCFANPTYAAMKELLDLAKAAR